MIRPGAEQQPLAIYGAGDHGRVVAEAAEAAGWRVVGFLDDGAVDASQLGWPLLEIDDVRREKAAFIVAIGDNAARRRRLRDLHEAGRHIAAVIHPHASVSPSATIHPGAFIGPAAVIHTAATIHSGAIVNSGAIVEHHVRIDACAHLAPGAALGGQVTVGAEALVGLNATVLPQCHIGTHAVVGAGAVVTRNIDNDLTVTGVPARPVGR